MLADPPPTLFDKLLPYAGGLVVTVLTSVGTFIAGRNKDFRDRSRTITKERLEELHTKLRDVCTLAISMANGDDISREVEVEPGTDAEGNEYPIFEIWSKGDVMEHETTSLRDWLDLNKGFLVKHQDIVRNAFDCLYRIDVFKDTYGTAEQNGKADWAFRTTQKQELSKHYTEFEKTLKRRLDRYL